MNWRVWRERALLGSCTALLAWDEETYLPRGGAAFRADQLAYLAGLEHEKATDPRLGDLLADVDNSDLVSNPLSDEAVNVREWQRQYARLTRVPQPLIEEIAARHVAGPTGMGGGSRRVGFPSLPAVVRARRGAVNRREADALGYESEPYDALLDEYEPGARGRDLDALFAELSPELTALAGRLVAAPRRPNDAVLHRAFPTDRQRTFNQMAAAALGFDFGAAGSTPRRTRSSPLSGRAIVVLRHDTIPTTSATPSSAPYMKSATASTNRGWTQRTPASPSARRRRLPSTSRSRACGKIRWAEAWRSGSTSSRWHGKPFPNR